MKRIIALMTVMTLVDLTCFSAQQVTGLTMVTPTIMNGTLVGSVTVDTNEYTTTEINDMMDKLLNPFRQVVQGTNTIMITANTEMRFLSDGATLNEVYGPSYMTNRWDTTTGVMTASSEYDTPTYMADLNFIWTPTASNEGEVIVRVYINETSPELIRTYRRNYAGDSADPYSFNATWYWGEKTGYDAKNNGVYFTVEFEHNGELTVPTVIIFNVQ